MNLPAIIFSIVFVAIAVTNIVMWRLDKRRKERIRGWRLTFYTEDWIHQCVFKYRDSDPIGCVEQYSVELNIWVRREWIYKVRKLNDNYYEAGCFTGTYEEMLERNKKTGRHPLLRGYYLRQLAKASR